MGKFKVGDWVRCIDDSGTDCVKRGQEYDVMGVREPYIDVLVDGELHGMYAHRFELVAPPLKIEAGKFYRTRDGRRVGPMDISPWGGFYDAAQRITRQRWEKDGSFINGQISNLDLIAEWQDTPAAPVSAQVDTLAEEYGPAPQLEPDTTLHIKFTSDFSELDAAILVRKKKLKKLIKLARKAGIELREAA